MTLSCTICTPSVPPPPCTFLLHKAHIPILLPSSSRPPLHIVCMLTVLCSLQTLQTHMSCIRCCPSPPHMTLSCTICTPSVPPPPCTFLPHKAHIPILLPSSSRPPLHLYLIHN